MQSNIFNSIIALKTCCAEKENSIMAEFNLTCSEYKALLTIGKSESQPCKVLAAKMGLSESRGNRVISRLINKGYFSASADKTDKRIVSVSLNSNGLKIKNKIHAMLKKCNEEINSKLTKKEIESFLTVINKVNRVLIKNN